MPVEAMWLTPGDLAFAFGERVSRDQVAAPALAVVRHKLVFAGQRFALVLAREA